ncbi:MAG: exodeoxyribonuclease VII large subunit, partial [Casimicrobiaceae bacterium]
MTNWSDDDPIISSPAGPTPTATSVSQLLSRITQTLDRAIPLLWVRGEISGFKRAASGHCYFDLKDERAQIACVLFRNRSALVPFALADGLAVECRVRVALYEPRGQLQCIVEQVRAVGAGELHEAFLRLKARLAAEGLFDQGRKRTLPAFPRSIGIITSREAAALADILRVLRGRWPLARVILYPASVQGAAAPAELRAALQTANARAECDLIIIGRGGGSLEDLWAFNDEALVRAVAASRLPIVSAVGHETDFTLCDFAADLRAPTPSAAALLATPDAMEVASRVSALGERLVRAQSRRLEQLVQRLDRAAARIASTQTLLAPWRERTLGLASRLARALGRATKRLRDRHARLDARWQALVANRSAIRLPAERLARLEARWAMAASALCDRPRQRLMRAAEALALLDPDRVLERGYAVVFDAAGDVVIDAARVRPGDALHLRL